MTSLLPDHVDLSDLELHRAGLGILPPSADPDPGTAISVLDPGSDVPTRSCTCRAARGRTCDHLRELGRRLNALGPPWPGHWDEVMRTHPWVRLLQAVASSTSADLDRVRLLPATSGETISVVADRGGRPLAWIPGDDPGARRARERLVGGAPRARLLDRLALFQLDAGERRLADLGMKTRRQTWEESLWYRLAIHLVRECPPAATDVVLGQLAQRGRPALAFRTDGRIALAVSPERSAVARLLSLLAELFPDRPDSFPVVLPLPSLFRADETTDLDSGERRDADREGLRLLAEGGEARFLGHPATESRRWGDLVLVPGLEVLAEVVPPTSSRRFKAPRVLRLAAARIEVLDLPAGRTDDGADATETETPRVLDQLRQVRLDAVPLARGRWWVEVGYGFGPIRIDLTSLLAARISGEPFLETTAGWIDLGIGELRHLERWKDLAAAHPETGRPGVVLSPEEILRLRGEVGVPVEVVDDGELAGLLDGRSPDRWRPPAGLLSPLREYQARGVEWLLFLWGHRLSGLLCDDMGLGKTHQSMAWMLGLREHQGVEEPFLVVAPTSVLPHWRDKIRHHAPSLRAVVHHGPDRDLRAALQDRPAVILTSYGVLRNDADDLATVPFAAAIFDEVQALKNRSTVSHQAARRLDAGIRVGLTGTPIENSLGDLKALFDLVLPGYLGSDAGFDRRYHDSQGRPMRLDELRRITGPFVLRRTKDAVLDELPSKIEDVRSCPLSDDQLELYRTAVRERARGLSERIASDETVPYLHVFALLTHLKRICDHPALALDRLDEAERWRSGKWDLYLELLRESLDSGQKVVVFSQYLGMLELMERHLRAEEIGFTILTGSTRDRGERVARFNSDPECRVFLGSLKAGGTGIDLVGGSVVIHYDRWWNAAREDQATDRVHRIGQHRAVQVFKLVAEDTLEERIHEIIRSKRELAGEVVVADDPRLSKLFTREQLLELLREPAAR